MKYFLIVYEQMDGEHQHDCLAVCKSRELERARRKAIKASKQGSDGFDHPNNQFAYGDRLTITRLYDVREITKEEYGTLIKLRAIESVL
jgi:hypothetical protein